MANLSMSMFANKEDFLKAKADLEKQEKEIGVVRAERGVTTATRLVTGVELKMQQSGKRWNLSVKKIV